MKVSIRNNPTITSMYKTSFFIRPFTFNISAFSNTSIIRLIAPNGIPSQIGIKESKINVISKQTISTIVDIFILFIYLY